jgi:flavin reductase (DIM6/NTAB) family NADH-FMN oxidoreductase RutF
MKKQLGPSDAIFPVPAALIVSGVKDDANIITIAWIGIASSTPPTIAISLRKTRLSLELIREYGEFTVNIPSSSFYKEVDYCGITTGRKRRKFDDTGFTPATSMKVKPPIIKECPYNIECKVTHDITIGDWTLILGEIVETHIDEDKADKSKRAGIDISRIKPLIYCAEVREYWDMGNLLGYGFDAGKEIVNKMENSMKSESVRRSEGV